MFFNSMNVLVEEHSRGVLKVATIQVAILQAIVFQLYSHVALTESYYGKFWIAIAIKNIPREAT